MKFRVHFPVHPNISKVLSIKQLCSTLTRKSNPSAGAQVEQEHAQEHKGQVQGFGADVFLFEQ